MYAVMTTGGKQYKVAQGDRLRIEKIGAAVGETVTFDQVLLVGGDALKIGTPLVAGAKVDGEGRRAGAREEDHRLQVPPP